MDTTKFQQLIVHFISSHEIKPMQVFIVLSPEVLFEKQYEAKSFSQQQSEEEKFLDIVPFHNTLTRTF